ncbi:hypothetical protein B566_EDAN001322 [Ephemera danica]|nr:hypothetical protein B566_EDAN001322 [Ephemera danica]
MCFTYLNRLKKNTKQIIFKTIQINYFYFLLSNVNFYSKMFHGVGLKKTNLHSDLIKINVYMCHLIIILFPFFCHFIIIIHCIIVSAT